MLLIYFQDQYIPLKVVIYKNTKLWLIINILKLILKSNFRIPIEIKGVSSVTSYNLMSRCSWLFLSGCTKVGTFGTPRSK